MSFCSKPSARNVLAWSGLVLLLGLLAFPGDAKAMIHPDSEGAPSFLRYNSSMIHGHSKPSLNRFSDASYASRANFQPALSPPSLRAALLYGPLKRPAFLHVAAGRLAETTRPDTVLKKRPKDDWIAFDKVQHTTFSFLWTLGNQYVLVNKFSLSERRSLPFSVGGSILIGLAKEVYDWRIARSRFFSFRDLTADVTGIALAAGIVIL